MFLYSKEGWVITFGTGLSETQPGHNKEQDIITSNKRSHRQVKGSQVL